MCLVSAVLLFLDVYPGSRCQKDPDQGSGFASENLNYINRKKLFLSCRKYDPGCHSRSGSWFFTHPGSRGKKAPDPQHCVSVWRLDLVRCRIKKTMMRLSFIEHLRVMICGPSPGPGTLFFVSSLLQRITFILLFAEPLSDKNVFSRYLFLTAFGIYLCSWKRILGPWNLDLLCIQNWLTPPLAM